MLIATWNVNSIRTRLEQVQDWITSIEPDVLCLQETKVDDPIFPKEALEFNNYKVCFHGQKSYNGVAIISRYPLEDIRFGLKGELTKDSTAIGLSNQSRVISALINDIRIVNVYVPNGSSIGSEKYSYKIEWLNCLRRYLQIQAKREEPLCILGDFNIALEDKDIHNPNRLSGGIMASALERDALEKVLEGRLKDAFRLFEQGSNHWSWWDYRSGAWDRDSGWRIDHIYLSNELLQFAKSCEIHKKVRGNAQPSDHAPVVVDVEWPPEVNQTDDMDIDFFA